MKFIMKVTHDVYLANSQDDGGIYIVDTTSNDGPSLVKLVNNYSNYCMRVYDVSVSDDGDVYYSDVDAKRIGTLEEGRIAKYIAGSRKEIPCDGCNKSASFIQPTGLCVEGRTLYLTDTGTGSLKILSPTRPICNFMQHVQELYSSHGIHSPQVSLSDAIDMLEESTTYFETAIQGARERAGGRNVVEGPHGMPSSRTVESLRMSLDALKSMKSVVNSINTDYVHLLQPKALVTLIVEHFNSRMREVFSMPTVLQFARQFPSAVEETMKRTTNCGFDYFTHRKSYYDVPDNMISLGELPKLPRPPMKHGSKEDVALLRKWAKEYGRATRQLTVRDKSTKDNPGTLPITAYGRRKLPVNPSEFVSEVRQHMDPLSSSSSSDESDDEYDGQQEQDTNTQQVIFLKDSLILIAQDHRISGPFLLGTIINEWRPISPTDSIRTHIYSPDPEDVLLFHYEFTGMVMHKHVICKLESEEQVHFLDDDFHMEISSDLYHVCVVETSKQSQIQEEAPPTTRDHISLRGRSLRLPHRFRE